MASTYSASLRLELMATGDQSGTWGTTTNTNLGTLLEQAITGVLSVAEGDTTLTLTTNNGASDQARNAVVNLTGAMTAARNVVVQTANKLYLIKNSTSGGFNITAKTSAGSGVEIPPGTARWVYSDGTNVVDGLPVLNYGYATTATAAGTTTLTVGSAYYQYFTGSTTQTVVLPVTSTLVLGWSYYIVNTSSGALTVNSSGGNLVATVAANSSAQIVCVLTSGTSAASWNVISVNLSSYLPLAGGTMTGQLINTGSTVGYTPIQLISTEAAAAAGPIIELYRNSASPAANDVLGQTLYTGQSTSTKRSYAYRQAVIVDPTDGAEYGAMDDYVMVNGTATRTFSVGPNNPNTPSGFVDGYATTATAAGTTTLTVTSAKNQYFTGTSTQTVKLPVVTTLPQLGWQSIITNNSTGIITVQSSGANTILVIGPGQRVIFSCILLTGTTAASWDAKPIGIFVAVPTASTSGTSIAYTSLPTNPKRITLLLNGTSTNGSSNFLIQIGPSGGVASTGYTSFYNANGGGATGTSTSGFVMINQSGNTYIERYVMELFSASANTWSGNGTSTNTTGSQGTVGAGFVSLSGVATQIKLTTANGTDTFNAGNISLLVEC